MSVTRCFRRRPHPSTSSSDLCTAFCSLHLTSRGISTSAGRYASTGSNNATPNPMSSAPPGTTKRNVNKLNLEGQKAQLQQPVTLNQPAAARGRKPSEKKKPDLMAQVADDYTEYEKQITEQMQRRGSLADNSIFTEDLKQLQPTKPATATEDTSVPEGNLVRRNPNHMAAVLNPNPTARARWHRRAVITHVRRRGRLTREVRIARTEREHLAKSRFMRTSIKKLAPLARQIAGKPIDEAIIQMRFSKKKPAKEILRHLLQARDEAIVIKGMGLAPVPDPDNLQEGQTQSNPAIERSGPVTFDPATAVPLPSQTASREMRPGAKKNPTDMYISEAWVNRGSYLPEASARARGRVDMIRHPHTGISVVLKEEKTRIRQKEEKEAKALAKKMRGKVWRQLPDRPVYRQSQYVLW